MFPIPFKDLLNSNNNLMSRVFPKEVHESDSKVKNGSGHIILKVPNVKFDFNVSVHQMH